MTLDEWKKLQAKKVSTLNLYFALVFLVFNTPSLRILLWKSLLSMVETESCVFLGFDWCKISCAQEGPKFNLRKAGEGSDVDPKWKKATIYKKENEEEDEEEEEEAVVYLQRSTR